MPRAPAGSDRSSALPGGQHHARQERDPRQGRQGPLFSGARQSHQGIPRLDDREGNGHQQLTSKGGEHVRLPSAVAYDAGEQVLEGAPSQAAGTHGGCQCLDGQQHGRGGEGGTPPVCQVPYCDGSRHRQA